MCPKLEEEEDEEVPNEISRLLGHLGRQNRKQKYQEECPEKGIHLQRLARDATIILQVYTSTGAARLLPSVHSMEVMLSVEVKVSSIGVMLKSKLELKCMTTLYNYIRRDWNKLLTRRFIPVISRNLVLKKTLSFQPDSRGKWTPNYEGACAMTHVTTNVDKPACRCS